VILAHVVLQLVRVEPLGIVEVARVIADGNRRYAEPQQQHREVRADVAETLDDERRALEIEAPVGCPIRDRVYDALARGLFASQRPARGDGLARDHALDALS